MRRTIRTVPDVYPPTADFSQAVRVRGGDLVFVSGIVGMRADGSLPAGAGEQIELAFENLVRVLAAAGAAPADVVKVNLFVGDDFRDVAHHVRAVRARWFDADYPVSTLVRVAGFANPDYRFEIEATAVVPPGGAHEDAPAT